MMKQLGLFESCSSEKMEQVALLEANRTDRDNLMFICRYVCFILKARALSQSKLSTLIAN